MKLPRFPVLPPWRGLSLALVCALYLFVGLLGHDPWKNDDAFHFGVALSLIEGEGGGLPKTPSLFWLETPPLFYWVAAACGRVFGAFLPLHDAVRLASGLFGALFLTLLAFSSRLLYKPAFATPLDDDPAFSPRRLAGNAAPLIAIGCLGLLLPLHDTQPLTAYLAASAATYGGLALLPQRPLAGGTLTGLGLGLGFLASGQVALLHLFPLLLFMPLHPHWRSKASWPGLLLAATLSVLFALIWPAWLALKYPGQESAWFGLVLETFQVLHFQSETWGRLPQFAELLAWFAWPALPLAIWALVLNRQQLARPAIALPLLGAILSLLVLLFFGEPRPLQALPLLVPLILQAASSAHLLRRGAANAFDWFGMMTFTFCAGMIWLGGIAMTAGVPAKIAHNFAKLEPGFVAVFSPLVYGVALALTLAWLWMIFASPRSPWRSISHWAAGLTMTWVLLSALWMPWIDYGKTYRGVALQLRQALPESISCVTVHEVGFAQQVSIHYFVGLRMIPASDKRSQACSWLLVQRSARNEKPMPGWKKTWEGHRPGDRSERLSLYQRLVSHVE